MTRLLVRLGKLPPHHLGIAYSAAACVGTAFQFLGKHLQSPGLIDFGTLILGIAILLLYIVVTYNRQDDALAAGFLLALTVIIGSIAASILAGMIVYRSLTAGFALLTLSPFTLVEQAFLLIPISAAIVWIARKVSALFDPK